jgi:hypothetical protein
VTIPLTPVERAGERAEEPPYRLFLLSSLLLAAGAGFVLAVLIPLISALEWEWRQRSAAHIQAHGQMQLLGFVGLFVMGMALRLMPRFSGRPLAFPELVVPAWGMLVAGLAARLLAQLIEDGPAPSLLVGSTIAVGAGSACYAVVIAGTLANRRSRAEATGYFFLAAAAFLAAQGVIGFAGAVEAAADGEASLPYLANTALVFAQVGGFLVPVAMGVATRALPTMTGGARSQRAARAVALGLGASAALLVGGLLVLQYGGFSRPAARVADGGLVAFGALTIAGAGLTGVFRPGPSRLRPASQPHLWLVRSALGWLALAGGLSVYFGAATFGEGNLPDAFELDAVRHALGLGFLTQLIAGMALMIVPEFAAERQTRPEQGALSFTLLALMMTAAVLRVAPALAGNHWPNETRSWLMAAAGLLGEGAVLLFAGSFLRLAWRRR